MVKRTKVFVAEAGHLVRVRVRVRVRLRVRARVRARVRVRVPNPNPNPKGAEVFVAEAGHQRGARLASRSGCGMPATVSSGGCNRRVCRGGCNYSTTAACLLSGLPRRSSCPAASPSGCS